MLKAITETELAIATATRLLEAKWGAGSDFGNIPSLVRDIVLLDSESPAYAWIYEEYRAFAEQQTAASRDASLPAFIAATRTGAPLNYSARSGRRLRLLGD